MDLPQIDRKLSVQEAKETLFKHIGDVCCNFKFLKSRNCFKAVVGYFVFELQFYFNAHNYSYEYIGVECDFNLWYKKFGKECNVDTYVTGHSYRFDESWFEITTTKELDIACKVLEEEISNTMIKIYKLFETGVETAVLELFKNYDSQPLALDVVADVLGKEIILDKAKEIYSRIPKDEIETYLDQAKNKNKAWMINRCDMKYVMDTFNRLIP